MPASEKQPMSETSGAGTGEGAGERIAQVLLLIWALGTFYHFFRSNGFFELVGQIVESGL
jgi:hypothetical protein